VTVAASITGDPLRYPSAEELRMVRAIASLAIVEASRNGESRATFHGFRVQAIRGCAAPDESGAPVEVNLIVRLGTRIVERSVVAASDAEGMEPKA
jgi:hypothetical protein